MATTLIVGAGGSLAQGYSYRPKQTREHPPLDGNFFERARSLSRHAGVQRHLRRLSKAVSQHGGLPDPVQGDPLLEQFFADVYYEVASMRSSRAFPVFVELLHLYVVTIAATTNWIGLNRRIGVIGRLMRLLKAQDPDLTVVTFNHDLVLENAALRMPGGRDGWCLQSLYGEPDVRTLNTEGEEKFRYHRDDCLHEPPFRLLKLHGSLNWGVRSLKKDPAMGTLFPTKQRQIFMHDTRYAFSAGKMSGGSGGGRKSWYFWPLIVPPIYDKSRVTGMAVLNGLWGQASEAIRSSERLVLFGYSLPDADVLAAQMLRHAFRANQNLERVDCINPDAAIANKLKSRLDCFVGLFRNRGGQVHGALGRARRGGSRYRCGIGRGFCSLVLIA